MGFYSRVIFPRLCEAALNRPFVEVHRRKLLGQASGDILEIGFGTGLNLPCYPDHVRRIAAVEPNACMHHKALARLQQTGIEVDTAQLGGEQLPYESASFDTVVSTFTLCSIGPVDRALEEIYRVLKPDGRFLFLEHGLSPEPGVSRWQHRLNRLQRFVADNCHLDRDIRALVGQQPYQSIEAQGFYLEKTPRTHGYLTQGVARK
jgi:ubiquinone/menaquinone biosynthesis C-methylase UbiE